MQTVPIESVPNQSFNITLGGSRYAIELKAIDSVSMCATIFRDGALLISGIEIVAGSPIIPYQYLESGNFIFSVVGDELPYWDKFGTTQSLIYFSAEEIAEIRRG